jgi:hypothetical protein
MHKVLRRLTLQPLAGHHRLARIDRQHDRQRRGRLALEDCNRLRRAVLEELKVLLLEAAHRSAVCIHHVHRHVHQPRLHAKRPRIVHTVHRL